MFDKEQSDAFVLAPEGMNERRIPVLVLQPLLEWCEELHHFGVSSGGGPHECRDAVLVCRVLVGNDGLGGFCVSTLESPVERCDSDCRSFPSHAQRRPLQPPCDSLVQQSQAQSCHWRPSLALVEVPPGLGHVPTGSRAHEGCLAIRRRTLHSRLGTGVDIAAPGRSV